MIEASRRQREMQTVPSLVSICQAKVFEVLKENRSNGRLIKQLSKICPDFLMEPIFDRLLEQNVLITDVVLVSYFTPYRTSIKINHAIHIRNSLFKLIGLNCRQLVSFSFNLLLLPGLKTTSGYGVTVQFGFVRLRASFQLSDSHDFMWMSIA